MNTRATTGIEQPDHLRKVRLRNLTRSEKSSQPGLGVRPYACLAAISIAARPLVQPIRMPTQRLQLAQHDLGR